MLRTYDATQPPCPAPTWWQRMQASGPLLHWYLWLGTYSVGPPPPPPFGYGALWDSKAPHWHTCERVSYCVETSPVSRLPVQDGSLSVRTLSLFLAFIFCPISFWRDWAAFLGVWYPLPTFRSCFVEVAQHSNDLLVNLWGRKWSSCPILLPSSDHSQPNTSSLKGPSYSESCSIFSCLTLGLVKLQPPGISCNFSNLPLFLQIIYYFLCSLCSFCLIAWSTLYLLPLSAWFLVFLGCYPRYYFLYRVFSEQGVCFP